MGYLWIPATAFLVLQLCAAFKNPIIPGFNPDPSITRVGNDYFLATSTFEFFPGVPIYHSTDLIKWNLIGHALNRPSQLTLRGTAPSGGIFAPTLRYHESSKTFYMITTRFDVISPPDITMGPRSFFVKTTNIFDDDAWSDPTYVDLIGIDPDLFWEDDGTMHLSMAANAAEFDIPEPGPCSILHTTIDPETGESVTGEDVLHVSTLPLNTPRFAEGSHLYKIGKYYYLFTAEAGTENWHREMVKRAESLDGPWEQNPYNPIIFNGRNLSNPVLATGHADLVETPDGDWFLVFLATRPQAPSNGTGLPQLGRETFMAPVKWVDDWPVVNDGKDITTDIPDVLYDLERPKLFRDDFNGNFTDKGYYTPRTPYKIHWDLEAREGWVRIKGNPFTLNDREIPAVLLRKQVDLATVWSTELDFTPTTKHHEAGVTVYLSIHYHDEIAVVLHPETKKRAIVTKIHSGTNAALNQSYHPLPDDYSTVKLFIKAEPEKYSFGYATGDEEPKYVAEVESRWLQSFLQGWQNFVGSHFGIYASGNGWPMRAVADFNYVQTELLE